MPSLRNNALVYLVGTLMLLSGTAQAQWLTGYNYRKTLAINAGVSAGIDYQILVKVGESSGAAGYDLHLGNPATAFPNDLRFTDDDGSTELGHYLESITGNPPNRTATFWVKVKDTLDSSQSIKVYYGKSGAPTGSNGDTTFSFFDNFSGSGPGTDIDPTTGIDKNKWFIDTPNGGNPTGWSVINGELVGSNTQGRVLSKTPFSAGTILESKFNPRGQAAFNGYMALGFYSSFGWFVNPGRDAVKVNNTWPWLANECTVPVIARITARATQVDLYVYRQDTGAVWHDQPNNVCTITNQKIRLGTRYDNNYNATAPGQGYDATWDWVRVRKYAPTIPTIGAAGAEQISTPSITLTTPAPGATIGHGAPVFATATVPTGTPPFTVEYYTSGNALIGTSTQSPDYAVDLDKADGVVDNILAVGSYTIYAKVTDGASLTATTANRAFSVATDTTKPTPDPMTFAVVPSSISPTSIQMAATTATDAASSPVQYYFWNITNNNNSGWQSSPIWTDSNLTPGVSYTYKVQARDSAATPNVTAWSGEFSATPSEPVVRTVPLANFGFENPFRIDGESSSAVSGWKPFGNLYFDAFFGAWNPLVSNYTYEAPEGRNVGVVYKSYASTGCSQVLEGAAGQFQANTAYDLRLKVGGGSVVWNSNLAQNETLAFDGYLVQLVVNGVVIAQDNNSRTPAFGSFITTSIKYNYNAALHSGLVGYPMEIRLLTKGLGNGLGIVSFDDVQLTYATSNPLANHGGPYRISKDAPLSLNGSASIPSPGAAITTYEWDLESRNDHLGFIANHTGPTPTNIPYATLRDTYGMVIGANTIRLRITDNAGQSVIGMTTVSINPLYTYRGPYNPRGTTECWNTIAYWDSNAVPSGSVDVVIPASPLPVPAPATSQVIDAICISPATPEFTGNLTIGARSQISCGYGIGGWPVYNCMGTPGSTVITMNSGSSFSFRIGRSPIIPAIALNGNASFTLGSSTVGGATGNFNYPITGAYRFSLNGNGYGSCIANFNAPNTFSELYTAGGAYVDGGVTIQGNAPGSLGTGNITINRLVGANNYSALVVINVANSMADTATLSMDGDIKLNNQGQIIPRITMNANDTIAKLVISGSQLPAGTYGGPLSSATFKQTWMAGTGILTVTEGVSNYWDIDGAIAGAGGINGTDDPSGIWGSATNTWSNSITGEASTASWISGKSAVFAAGTSATGPYTVTVGDSNAITVTNSFKTFANIGTNSLNTTKAGWTLNNGNCVAILISAINATNFTATYAGQAMTVQGVYESKNTYVGIAYIISDSLPATGDVVINMPRVVGSGNSGGYANMGYVYSILSLSNVATAGTAVSHVHPPGSNPPASKSLTYSTSVNNGYVLGVVCDSDWNNRPKTVVGTCNQIISQDKPAYYNSLLCSGSVVAAGTYTDTYSSSLTALITLPFNAKTTANPLLTGTGQKIAGLTFEEGTVTINGGNLELQTNSPFTNNSSFPATIASKITGLSGLGPIKKGPGTVVFSNPLNNYTGTTTINNGILRLGASDALPNTPVILKGDGLGVTATLDLNGYSDTLSRLSFGGSFANNSSAVTTGGGTLTLSGSTVDFASENDPLGATISGNLALGTGIQTFNIEDSWSAANDLTISAIVSGDGGITKGGFGTLQLSGSNIYTGATTVSNGLLILSGADNSAATGGITVSNGGAIRFDALGSINGSGTNVTIESGGLAYFGPLFGSGNIQTALTGRINLAASTGVIAVDNFSSADFVFTGLNTYLGALNDVTYTGNFTPNAGTYRIGGGSGTIKLARLNALTGSGSLLVGGSVIIAESNTFSGTTTINASGRLQIGAGGILGSLNSAATTLTNNGILIFNRSNDLTQGTHFWNAIQGSGIVEKSGTGKLTLNEINTYAGGTNLMSGTLMLENEDAIGGGLLSIYSGTLDAGPSALVLASDNNITLGGSFTFGGTANLDMGLGDVGNTSDITITLNGANKSLTFGGVMTNVSGGDQILTVDGPNNTLVLGGYRMSSDEDSFLMDITIGGTGNVSITGAIDDWSYIDEFDPDASFLTLGTLTKTGTGTLKLSGNNNYTGNTVVAGGVLHLASGTQISPIIVNNGGTLAFTLGTTITSSERLTLNDGHKIKILGTPTLPSYTLMSADSIVGGAPTLETAFALAFPLYFLEIAGSELRLTKSDTTAPVLLPADIVDDKNGGPVAMGTLITYTLTFNEDINHETVTAADFTNAVAVIDGGAAITIGQYGVVEISPGVFNVQVTPTTAGSLRLSIPPAAEIYDVSTTPAPNALDDDPAIMDDTTINVIDPATIPWLVSSDIEDDRGGAPVDTNTPIVYTLYFTRDINLGSVSSVDFTNAGTANITFGAIAEPSDGIITVEVTPTSAGTLRLSIPTTADIRDASNNMLDSDPAIDDDTTLTVIAAGYIGWSGGAGFNADANNDGVSNGMAWLLGAANTSTNAISLLPTFNNTSDPTYFIYTYRRSDAANTAPDTTIAVEYSSTLGGWSYAIDATVNEDNNGDIEITETDDFYGTNPAVDKVEVKIKRSLAISGKLFSRLNLVTTP